MKQVCGVYCISLVNTERNYVGQAKDVFKRWREHRWALSKGVNKSKRLQRAWNKYGSAAFLFRVLEECPCDPLVLLTREQYWIDELQAHKKGFNCSPVAGLSTLGVKFSASTKAKISEKAKGRVISEETRRKISDALKGRLFSSEHRARLSKVSTQRMLTSPYRFIIGKWSHNHPRFGKDNSFYGKHHSDDVKLIMSEKHQGKTASSELCALRSKNATGKNNPMFGRKHSEETKEKIRQARILRVTSIVRQES